ncbi:small multidrug efflux protein [Nonomuraea terrae]|uniref:Small multidrug efflux protein n=1 Tax=Nonomuraea terrae TaxID=2530383 RepID=A0A4R4XX68_9ACTN|nr:small multidrug efflux protein [Nonomuraea terrae]TDD35920.1 small multidrug efflux protein [Nonomuraea terrae]
MNPIETLVRNFQDLVAQVPEVAQPLIVMLAGAIPFLEGEGASPIGVLGGIHPIVAGIAAASGNFLSVLAVVLFSTRVRTTAVARRARRTETPTEPKPESRGRQRFRRYLLRFGVPGASILGPLAIPTQFTSAMLVASGTPRGWVLLWQAVAIVVWTTVTTTLSWGMLTALLA